MQGYMQDYTFPRLGSFVKRMCILHGYHPSDHDVDIWQADFLGCKEDVDSAKAEYSRWAALSVEVQAVQFPFPAEARLVSHYMLRKSNKYAAQKFASNVIFPYQIGTGFVQVKKGDMLFLRIFRRLYAYATPK